MPAPRILPDPHKLRALKERFTYAQIAEMYGVDPQSVYQRLRIDYPNAQKERPRYSDLIPWRIAKEHWYAMPVTMLRFYARRRDGKQLSPKDERRLDSWLEALRAADAVVDYDRDQPPNPASPKSGGWRYVKRLPEDGDRLIRVPQKTESQPDPHARDRTS